MQLLPGGGVLVIRALTQGRDEHAGVGNEEEEKEEEEN
jgi:hypothetical protein